MAAQAIFLNGPSSSGKSTLARALQDMLEEPFIIIAEDMFFATLPSRPYAEADFFRYGMRLYNGFTQCVRTLLECDNNVIVDTVAWVPGSLDGFVDALWDTNVLAVGIHCPLHILEQREHDRKDRGAGLARKQIDAVHSNALYDIELDTSQVAVNDAARQIVELLGAPPAPHAFARMKRQRNAAASV